MLLAATQTPVRSIHGRSVAVQAWPIWDLPSWLIAFVSAVVLADVAVFGGAASATSLRGHDLGLFAALLACDALTVELTRRRRREHRHGQGRVRDLGTARGDVAAAGLRTTAAHRPFRADPVADPPGPRVPAGVQRRRDRAQLRGRRPHLPRPDPPGPGRGRRSGQPRPGLDAVRGGLRGRAVDGRTRSWSGRPSRARIGACESATSSSPASPCTTTWPNYAWR